MAHWFKDADEIVVLFRNSKTGQESWVKLPKAREIVVDWAPEIKPGKEHSFHGGLMFVRENDTVEKVSFTLSADASLISYAKDSKDYHYNKGNQHD